MPAAPLHHRPLRVLAIVLLLALHAMGLLVLGSLRVWPDRNPAPQAAPLWLRLLPSPPQPAPSLKALPAPSLQAPQRPRSSAAPPWAPAAQPPSQAAAAATAPASVPLAAAAELPASAASAPLRLDLPRAGLAERRNPALTDERFRAERTTMETRIRDATGGVGETIIEERLADGTLKLRRGTSCVLVHPSRAATLDPFNEAFSKKARGVESCQ